MHIFQKLENAIAKYCHHYNIDEVEYYKGLASGGPINVKLATLMLKYHKIV